MKKRLIVISTIVAIFCLASIFVLRARAPQPLPFDAIINTLGTAPVGSEGNIWMDINRIYIYLVGNIQSSLDAIQADLASAVSTITTAISSSETAIWEYIENSKNLIRNDVEDARTDILQDIEAKLTSSRLANIDLIDDIDTYLSDTNYLILEGLETKLNDKPELKEQTYIDTTDPFSDGDGTYVIWVSSTETFQVKAMYFYVFDPEGGEVIDYVFNPNSDPLVSGIGMISGGTRWDIQFEGWDPVRQIPYELLSHFDLETYPAGFGSDKLTIWFDITGVDGDEKLTFEVVVETTGVVTQGFQFIF